MSTRAERMAYVRRVRLEIETDEILNPPRPTTQAQRRRIVEVMKIAAGDFTPAPWERRRAEPIDDTPWRASLDASRRAMARRFAMNGLAFDAARRAIHCTRCGEVLVAIPKGRVVAIGTTPSLMAAAHEAKGCR